jgi:hypothetical protein
VGSLKSLLNYINHLNQNMNNNNNNNKKDSSLKDDKIDNTMDVFLNQNPSNEHQRKQYQRSTLYHSVSYPFRIQQQQQDGGGGGDSSIDQFIDEVLDDDPPIRVPNTNGLAYDEEYLTPSIDSIRTPKSGNLIDLSYNGDDDDDDDDDDEKEDSPVGTGSFNGLLLPDDPFLTPTQPEIHIPAGVVLDSVRKVLHHTSTTTTTAGDGEEKTPFIPPGLTRPQAIKAEDRSSTPQSCQTPTSMMAQSAHTFFNTLNRNSRKFSASAPVSPRSPSINTHRSAKSETYYHTYLSDPKTPPRPVPPFVVVHNTGHALVKVTPTRSTYTSRKARVREQQLQLLERDQQRGTHGQRDGLFMSHPTILEETGSLSTTSTTFSCRSWIRPAVMIICAGALVLGAVTVAAGLIRANRNTETIPTSPPTTVPPPPNQAFPTLEPGLVKPPAMDDNNGVIKLPYEETESPPEALGSETRPPRTSPPTTVSTTVEDTTMFPQTTNFPTVSPTSSSASSSSSQVTLAPTSLDEVPWNNYVIGLLATESPDTFTELDDVTSPQWHALRWISIEYSKTTEREITYNSHTSLQRFALACLYYATTTGGSSGGGWNVNTNWLSLDTTECDWYGVTCDSSNTVIAVDLINNGLEGSIPSEISLLKNLQGLVLSQNAIGGTIPSSISNLTELIELVLTENELEGTVPVSFGSLDLVTTVDLSKNQLSGSIPSQIGIMLNLERLNLCGNDLTGQIPSHLSSLTYLQSLNVASNLLSGDMPGSVCDLGSVEVARGPVPDMVVDCSVTCECCSRCCANSNNNDVDCCSSV